MLLRELATAAVQAAAVLDGGDTAAALAAADALCATAAQARRLLKAAATGRKPRGTASPAARPGQLRDLVAAHLAGLTRTPTSARTRSAGSWAGPPAPSPTPWTGSPPSGRPS